MIPQFESLLADSRVSAFLQRAVQLYDDRNYPFLTYIGVDFCENNLLNLKLYAHGYKKYGAEEIQDLFPRFELIREHYSNFNETIYSKEPGEYDSAHPLGHMGTLFKFSLNTENEEVHTFFTRPKMYDHGPITLLELPVEEKKQPIDDYFCCELRNDSIRFKRYYPIEREENIRFVLDTFNFDNVTTDDVGIVEYLEYETRKKVAISFKGNAIQKYIPDEAQKLTNYLAEKYQLSAMGLGRCIQRNTYSLYFISNEKRIFFKDSPTFQKLIGTTKD